MNVSVGHSKWSNYLLYVLCATFDKKKWKYKKWNKLKNKDDIMNMIIVMAAPFMSARKKINTKNTRNYQIKYAFFSCVLTQNTQQTLKHCFPPTKTNENFISMQSL